MPRSVAATSDESSVRFEISTRSLAPGTVAPSIVNPATLTSLASPDAPVMVTATSTRTFSLYVPSKTRIVSPSLAAFTAAWIVVNEPNVPAGRR